MYRLTTPTVCFMSSVLCLLDLSRDIKSMQVSLAGRLKRGIDSNSIASPKFVAQALGVAKVLIKSSSPLPFERQPISD